MLLSHRVIKQCGRDMEDWPVRPRIRLAQDMPAESSTIQEMGQDAELILNQARAEADRLMAETFARIEILEQEARERGLAKGEQQAQEAALRLQEDFHLATRSVLQQIQEIRAKIYQDTEKEMVELAINMAEKIVCRQLEVEPDTILDIARTACNQAKDCELVIIYTHPSQTEVLRCSKGQIASQLYRNRRLEIIADANIRAGGCRIETEQGFIDATLDTMLAQLKNIMKEHA